MIHDHTRAFDWIAQTTEHKEKSVDWYWGLGIAIVAGCILAIIAQNYLLVVLLILGGTLLGFYANDRPHPISVEISARGIKFNKELYTYETMQSFWMYTDPKGIHKLLVVTGRPVMPERIVTLPETIPPTQIRNFLLQHLPEKETAPSAMDIVAESMGL